MSLDPENPARQLQVNLVSEISTSTCHQVGMDIEFVERFAARMPAAFHPFELKYADSTSNRMETLAGIWCAKEAVIKSLQQYSHINVRDVGIRHTPNSAPRVYLLARVLNGTDLPNTFWVAMPCISVSITHAGGVAGAVAFANNAATQVLGPVGNSSGQAL